VPSSDATRISDSGGPPRLAVVVPALDEAERLPALLASLGWTTAARRPGDDVPDALVVADGGSRDATVAIARAHGASVVTAPTGRGSQLAAGARAVPSDAAGPRDVLLFLHADARVAPGAVARVRAAFRDEAVAAAGLRQRIDADGWFYRSVERAADRRVRRGRIYGDSGLAVRRSTYERIGGFADLPIFEDLELSRRLRASLGARERVRWIDDAEVVVSARRWQAEGPLRRTFANWALTALWRMGVPPARLARFYRASARRRSAPENVELRQEGAA